MWLETKTKQSSSHQKHCLCEKTRIEGGYKFQSFNRFHFYFVVLHFFNFTFSNLEISEATKKKQIFFFPKCSHLPFDFLRPYYSLFKITKIDIYFFSILRYFNFSNIFFRFSVFVPSIVLLRIGRLLLLPFSLSLSIAFSITSSNTQSVWARTEKRSIQ